MIRVIVGDIFESDAQTLVNTVNCVGVMGAGIALEFKKRFPDYYDDYRERCEKGEVKLGTPYLHKRLNPPWILSFPTKDHWRSMTKLNDIVSGLEYLIAHYRRWGIESIAVPPLGSGHGQLEWRVVGRTLYRYLRKMEIPVELYAPYGIPDTEIRPEFLEAHAASGGAPTAVPDAKWIQPGLIGVVEILRRIDEEPYANPVGRTMFQKIAYLATEEGLPTGLEFGKGSYGPYSGDLKLAMARLLNNGLIEERRVGRMHRVAEGPTFHDARRAYQKELESWTSIMNRVVDLVMRTSMDTDMAELVATVIFVARRLGELQRTPLREADVVGAAMQWKQRRRPPLDQERVAYLVRVLAGLGWIDVAPSPELAMPALIADFA